MTTNHIADLLIEALKEGRDDSFERLAAVFSTEVSFGSVQANGATGPQAVISHLKSLQSAGRFARTLEWSQQRGEMGEVQVLATQPVSSQYSAYRWDVSLDATGNVLNIRQTGIAPTEELAPKAVHLSEDIGRALSHAHETNNPLILAYINSKGRPTQSPRGTVQIFSEDRLALWIWSRTGGLVNAITSHPDISIHYWGGIGTAFGGALLFQGVARLDDSAAVRNKVYENSPPAEQRQDPDRSGNALLIDVYRVSGFVAGFRYNMTNEVD